MTTTFTIEEAMERLAIEDMYARYIHAVDEQDIEVLDKIFMPETICDWTSAGHKRGDYQSFARDDILSHGTIFELDFHICGNFRVDFNEDLSEAKVKSKTLNASGMRDQEKNLDMVQIHGGYSDVLVKTGEGWKFKERVWNHGWMNGGQHLIGDTGGMLAGEE